jgi:hypothetical protein
LHKLRLILNRYLSFADQEFTKNFSNPSILPSIFTPRSLFQLPCDSYSILWTVEDFSRFLNADFLHIESSNFQPLGPGTASFCLLLAHESEGKFSIVLKLVERLETAPVHVTARLWLLDRGDGKHFKSEGKFFIR